MRQLSRKTFIYAIIPLTVGGRVLRDRFLTVSPDLTFTSSQGHAIQKVHIDLERLE